MSPLALGLGFSLVTALVVILGDFVIKLAADHTDPTTAKVYLTAGCGLYVVSALMWFGAMRVMPLGTAALAYSAFTLVGACMIGALIFGEPLGLRKLAAMALALGSVILVVGEV